MVVRAFVLQQETAAVDEGGQVEIPHRARFQLAEPVLVHVAAARQPRVLVVREFLHDPPVDERIGVEQFGVFACGGEIRGVEQCLDRVEVVFHVVELRGVESFFVGLLEVDGQVGEGRTELVHFVEITVQLEQVTARDRIARGCCRIHFREGHPVFVYLDLLGEQVVAQEPPVEDYVHIAAVGRPVQCRRMLRDLERDAVAQQGFVARISQQCPPFMFVHAHNRLFLGELDRIGLFVFRPAVVAAPLDFDLSGKLVAVVLLPVDAHRTLDPCLLRGDGRGTFGGEHQQRQPRIGVVAHRDLELPELARGGVNPVGDRFGEVVDRNAAFLLGAADGHLRAVRLKRCGELGKVGPVVEDVARKGVPGGGERHLGIDLAVVFRGEREGEEFEPGRICLDDGFVIVLVVVLLLLVFTGSGFGGGLLDAGRKACQQQQDCQDE